MEESGTGTSAPAANGNGHVEALQKRRKSDAEIQTEAAVAVAAAEKHYDESVAHEEEELHAMREKFEGHIPPKPIKDHQEKTAEYEDRTYAAILALKIIAKFGPANLHEHDASLHISALSTYKKFCEQLETEEKLAKEKLLEKKKLLKSDATLEVDEPFKDVLIKELSEPIITFTRANLSRLQGSGATHGPARHASIESRSNGSERIP